MLQAHHQVEVEENSFLPFYLNFFQLVLINSNKDSDLLLPKL